MPSENEREQNPTEQEDLRSQIPSDDSSKPDAEFKVDRLKFILVLGAILVFALIATNIKQFTGG